MYRTMFIRNWFKYYIVLICSKPRPDKRLAQPVTEFLPQPATEFLLMISRSNMEECQS